ncbi:MAG: hypothetical protein IK083_09040 [Abditibacteriota bacterium]|nr:hypothetical protein [Abditibacteriota bacterium]
MRTFTVCILLVILSAAACMADLNADVDKSVAGIHIENEEGLKTDVSGFFVGTGGCLVTSDSVWLDFSGDGEMAVGFEDMKMTARIGQESRPVSNYNFTDSGHTILLTGAFESPLQLGSVSLKTGDVLTAAGFDPEKGKPVTVSVTLGAVTKDSAVLTAPLEDFYCGGPVFKSGAVAGYVYEAGGNPVIYITDPDDIAAGISECLDNLKPRENTYEEDGEDGSEEDAEEEEEEAAVELKGGKAVFGAYMDKPITWQVLKKEGSEALLLSEQALGYGKFHAYKESVEELKAYKAEHNAYPPVTWEDSTLRGFLNAEFFFAAFSPRERSAILDIKDTEDRVTLLSEAEAKSFFNRYDARVCRPSEYARKQGAPQTCPWWLRSEGMGDMRACAVTKDGRVEKTALASANTATALAGIRPVIRVRVK